MKPIRLLAFVTTLLVLALCSCAGGRDEFHDIYEDFNSEFAAAIPILQEVVDDEDLPWERRERAQRLLELAHQFQATSVAHMNALEKRNLVFSTLRDVLKSVR
jgi:hypothetical protein